MPTMKIPAKDRDDAVRQARRIFKASGRTTLPVISNVELVSVQKMYRVTYRDRKGRKK